LSIVVPVGSDSIDVLRAINALGASDFAPVVGARARATDCPASSFVWTAVSVSATCGPETAAGPCSLATTAAAAADATTALLTQSVAVVASVSSVCGAVGCCLLVACAVGVRRRQQAARPGLRTGAHAVVLSGQLAAALVTRDVADKPVREAHV
jgi:hypothetical protein